MRSLLGARPSCHLRRRPRSPRVGHALIPCVAHLSTATTHCANKKTSWNVTLPTPWNASMPLLHGPGYRNRQAFSWCEPRRKWSSPQHLSAVQHQKHLAWHRPEAAWAPPPIPFWGQGPVGPLWASPSSSQGIPAGPLNPTAWPSESVPSKRRLCHPACPAASGYHSG